LSMKPVFENPPRTIMEVYKNLPEGTLAELIDNVIYMSPSPVYKHQEVLLEISSQLKQHLKDRGKVVIAPFDIYLNETSNAVQPDIVLILNSNNGILKPNGHFHGIPDIIIEILSPGNQDHDLVKKKELYERFGVKEYWIVDPQTKETLGYTLKDSKYLQIDKTQGNIPFRLLHLPIVF
jgi:Uma2 family endonuclease